MAKDYELENCSHQQSFRKNVEMEKSGNSLVRSQREREGQKISAIVSNIFKIDRFSNWSRLPDKRWQLPLWFLLLSSSFPKSACPTQALRRLWCILRFSRFFSKLKTWPGHTWQCAPMTDRFLPQGNVSVKSKLQHPPSGHTPGIWHLFRPGEKGIWFSESSRGWGIWSPCEGGGEFEP